MLRKVQSFCLLFFLFALPAVGQTAPASQAATEARVDSMLKQLNLEEKIDLLGGVDSFYIRAIPRIGLPRLKMADGPLGVRNYGPSTAFGGIGLAATWDPTLAQRIGAVIGQDAVDVGIGIDLDDLAGHTFRLQLRIERAVEQLRKLIQIRAAIGLG